MNNHSMVPFGDLVQFLKTGNPLLQQLIDALPIPIFCKDINGIYLGANRSFEKFLKLPREEFIGLSTNDLFDPKAAQTYNEADMRLFKDKDIQIYEAEFKPSDNETHIIKFHKCCFYDESGNVAGLIGAIFDITEQKKLEQKLRDLASYDSLTKLFNRREGLLRAQALYEDWKRHGDAFAILYIDVDHFKKINDNYGHEVGDNALCHIAQILQSERRANDIVVRHGGEEFVIWLPKTALNQAQHVALRYCQIIEQSKLIIEQIEAETCSMKMTISVGVAESKGQTIDEIISNADHALYRAKKMGRNRVEV